MITLLADEGKHGVGQKLHKELLANGADCRYISLDQVRVEPCRNCGGCTYQSYNRCVVRDDGDWIFPQVLQAGLLILVTPLVFGGYSFKVKRVLDKFGLIMDRHYFVEKGELVKGGLPDRPFRLMAVGVREGGSGAEASAFSRLIRELLIITRGAGKPFIVDPGKPAELETLELIAKEALGA
ncbi:NAD(P)H-dependent oxidoreductase [Paenibacillus sp. YN15]|uniref:NAD(P)H-dependent oxidoreductase n=1 Tax=Paenibacillus sp. YN15 TaxID=1742774 RepID=UPI000DCD9986|nr:NAD(P)H-dependent oxidoreductase [Paenibacillus sp. YN15]RAU92810.1 hypothetical protein DQG13_26705 [Paenibacillus sp. YN15]